MCDYANRKMYQKPSSTGRLEPETRTLRPAKDVNTNTPQDTSEGVRKRAVDNKVCINCHEYL